MNLYNFLFITWERGGSRIPRLLSLGWSEPSQVFRHALKNRKSLLLFNIMFFDTIATGGSSHLWLGCDKHWNCVVLAMAMVRSPTTSYWCLNTDTKYGSVTKNLAILQNQWKTSQMEYLYAINRSIMMQKAIVIA